MPSRQEYMTECAQSYLDHGDKDGHDAIMEAIDNPHDAKLKYPDRVIPINNAINYALREMKSCGHQ